MCVYAHLCMCLYGLYALLFWNQLEAHNSIQYNTIHYYESTLMRFSIYHSLFPTLTRFVQLVLLDVCKNIWNDFRFNFLQCLF